MSKKAPTLISPSFAFSYVERALWEGLGRRQFGSKEMDETLRFFGYQSAQCVYCGSPDVRGWDHLIAVRRGGETVLGNMVPACGPCDDSKGALDCDVWMLSSAKKSPSSRGVPDVEARLRRIGEYMAHHGFRATLLDDRVSGEERLELEQIRADTRSLRNRIERFLLAHKTRASSTVA